MNLRDVDIKSEYRSKIDDVIEGFYVPLLENAASYKRAVGFFSSSALIEISKGIATMARKGGKIQIVASPYLSAQDVEAIKLGYEERDKVIERALLRELQDSAEDYFSEPRLNMLANLIADGNLDIRIAFVEAADGIGMYHEKMGLIEDDAGNAVAFSGSMNESATAMVVNYETIDVFKSWGDGDEAKRVFNKRKAFQSIWEDLEPHVTVLEFPAVSQAIIEKYQRGETNFNIDKEEFPYAYRKTRKVTEQAIGARIASDIRLHDYQRKAIAAWQAADYRGIFDMATGTGKTFTGLGAIAALSEAVNDRLAVVIVCPFQHLVEQWVEDIRLFNMKPIIGHSASQQKDWKKRLSKAISDQELREEKRFFCFVCTNATFKSKFVQAQINKITTPILLVVDEAHNFGAQGYARLLDERFEYRLALSATVDRNGDEEGTAALYRFFGEKCIEYSLEQAIRENKLTPYRYYPVVIYLNEDELRQYEELSTEIARNVIHGRDGKTKLNRHAEFLSIKRARIVAGAAQKLDALREEIKPYINEHNILIYCGATKVDYEKDGDGEDLRQIEAVTQILGVEYGMRVARFTSQESMPERETLREHFQSGDDLQALIAIKCLDEGVNIPGIRTAFILASTTNPKEYIQRRGRVLRKAPGKDFAEIYDFVTLPRRLDEVPSMTKEAAKRDLALVKNEVNRLKEFSRIALNSSVANQLIWNIEDAYHLGVGMQGEEAFEDGIG